MEISPQQASGFDAMGHLTYMAGIGLLLCGRAAYIAEQDCQLYRTVDEVTSRFCNTVPAAAQVDAHSNDSPVSSLSWQTAILSAYLSYLYLAYL